MWTWWKYRFRRTTLWSVGCGGLLAGIGLAHHLTAPNALLVWLGLVGVVVNLRQRTIKTVVLVAVFAVGLGWQRGHIFADKLAAYQPYFDQKVSLTVWALDDGVYGKNGQLTFDATNLMLDSGERLAGKVDVSGFGMNAVFQGDEVEVGGTLRSGLGQYQGFMSFAQLQLVQHHSTLVAEIRRKFAAGMQTALPEPLASFAMGLLIGQRATLPAGVKQILLMVGLTHIIAVSGYNLTIILEASRRLLGKFSKHIAIGLSLLLIGVFLLLAGASASIVRAAIVSMLSIVASYYGRRFKPLLLILLAAAITAWMNPFYIWSDISWYLSFLAFYGVLVIGPVITERLHRRWQQSLIANVALESVCAELMTMPFILCSFGQVSLVGLPANVLVVTLVPLAMLLSAVAGLAGMTSAVVAGWLAWPARVLLTYMLDVAQLLSQIPGIFRQQIGLSLHQMLILYMLIIMFSVSLHFKSKRRAAILTDKNSVLETE